MVDLEKLREVSIDDCILINKQIKSDPVYALCIKYGIDNIGDFIEFYNKYIKFNKKYNLKYFEGIISLICFNYFYFDLKYAEVLDKFVYFLNYMYDKSYYSFIIDGDKNSLKSLGFTNNESKLLLNYAFKVNKKIKVIDLLNMYLNDNKNLTLNKYEQDVFLYKLKLLIKYYDKEKNQSEITSDKLNKIENLYSRYDNLTNVSEKSILEKLRIISEILKIKDSLNTEEIKQYRKKYFK